MSGPWTVVGIDPAPKKRAIACVDGARFEAVEATDLPKYVSNLVASHDRLLIAWDAPLNFDPANGYSDRPADRDMRAWVKAQVEKGRLAKGAVSVLPFSGCSHWAITCASLGMPFGGGRGLKLAARPDEGDKLVVEVHPAVTLARWWVRGDVEGAMPKYKGISRGKQVEAIGAIVAGLRDIAIPEAAAVDDDHLDAWVAWRMGADFVAGDAGWCGSPREGGYVVPLI